MLLNILKSIRNNFLKDINYSRNFCGNFLFIIYRSYYERTQSCYYGSYLVIVILIHFVFTFRIS